MKNLYRIALAAGVAITLMAGSCVPETPATPVKESQSALAAEAANSISFAAGNAEIDNIKKRLQLTSDPGLMGYIVLLDGMGTPILYTTVKGKVTSGSKRLTTPVKQYAVDCGQYCSTALGEAPSDEGTYGSSNPYIYFWTTEGQYYQWGASSYLYSDKPFRLSREPLVVSGLAPAN